MSYALRFLSPSVLFSLAALGMAAHAAAADTTAAEENVLGLNLATSTRFDQNCGIGPCDRKASSSGKVFYEHLWSLAPMEGFALSHGVEIMGYRTGHVTAAFATANGTKSGNADTQGLGLSYVLQAQSGPFATQGRIGASYARSRVDYLSGRADRDNSLLAPSLGLGARYALSKNLSLNADYDRLPTRFNGQEKGHVNMFSLGLGYHF